MTDYSVITRALYYMCLDPLHEYCDAHGGSVHDFEGEIEYRNEHGDTIVNIYEDEEINSVKVTIDALS
jgi:hypothetical protein